MIDPTSVALTWVAGKLLPEFDKLLTDSAKLILENTGGRVLDEGKILTLTKKIKEKYSVQVRETWGVVKILQMKDPVRLEDIFVIPEIGEDLDIYKYNVDHIERSAEGLQYGRRGHPRVKAALSAIIRPKCKIIFLGDPGAGKSTLLRAIAVTSVSNSGSMSELKQEGFPIYIELRRYAEELKLSKTLSIEDYFILSLDKDKITDLIFKRLMSNGNAVFLLDALDEVPTEQQNDVIDKIQHLIKKYPDCSIISSSRIGDYKRQIDGCKSYEILDFDDSRRIKFLRN